MSHDPNTVLHSDDQVARHLSRRTASILVAVGLFLAGLGSAGLFVILIDRVNANHHSTELTASQVQQIRQLLAERKTQRDDEQAQVQAQLGAQARVLCTVLGDFLGGPSGGGHDVIARAYADLKCAGLAKTPPKTPAAASPSSSTHASAVAPAVVRAPKPRPVPGSTSTTRPPTAAPPVAAPSPPALPLDLPVLTTACRIVPLLC